MTKLQTALALSPEQVAALPPPTLRIRQLEQENSKLLRENDELRRQLHMQTRRPSSLMTDPHFDMARRGSFHSSVSADYPDRDLKRRRMSQNVDEVYLVIVLSSQCALHVHARLHSRSILFFANRALRFTEPQPDSESTHDRGARTSLQLLATTATVSWRLHALVEHQHLGVLKPGPELVQLDAVLGSAKRPCELSAACDEHTELQLNTYIVLGKYFISVMAS